MRLLIITQKVDVNDAILGFMHNWILEFAKNTELVTVVCLQKGQYCLPPNVRVLSLGKEVSGEASYSLSASRTKPFASLRRPSLIARFARNQINSLSKKTKYALKFFHIVWRERKNYDSVFVHMNAEYMVLGGLFWKLTGKKTSLWYAHKTVSFKLRIAQILADIIFTASPESFRLRSKKLKILGHGINTEYFSRPREILPANYSKNIFKIISVSRISPSKDLAAIINAAARLKNQGLAVKVDIVGGTVFGQHNEYLAGLKKIVAEKDLGGAVSFLGPMPHNKIKGHYISADIFVNASRTGSLDKAILEAMACELIAVSSNDAARSILPASLLFKEGDTADLAKKIEFLYGLKPGDRLELGRHLREIVVKDHNLPGLIKKITAQLDAKSF